MGRGLSRATSMTVALSARGVVPSDPSHVQVIHCPSECFSRLSHETGARDRHSGHGSTERRPCRMRLDGSRLPLLRCTAFFAQSICHPSTKPQTTASKR
jgi:hypothetical protein